MDYFDHLELRAGLDVLWVTRSVAVPDHVRKLRVRPGDPRMQRILSLRQDPVALRRFCARSLSHLQVGRLTDAQLESAVESELESGRLCALVLTLGDAHTAQAQVESASRVPLPPMKPIVAAHPAAQPKAAPGAVAHAKPVVATKVIAPTLTVPGPGTQRLAAATAVAQPQLQKDPDEALGERFSEVISRAGKRAPNEIKQVLLELTSPESIRMMVYIAAGLGVAMLAGVGEIAIAGLLAWAYFEGGKAAVLGVTDLVTFMMLTYNAKTDRDLDDAADALVSAAKALVTVGMVVLLHRMAARKAGPNKPKPVEKRSAPRNPEVRRPLPVEEETAGVKPKDKKPKVDPVIAARQATARNFFEKELGLPPHKAADQMKGIDFSKPVELVDIPPPDTMSQYVVKGKPPGNWFNPDSRQTPETLGINADPAIRELKTFKTPTGKALRSTAAPIVDYWTNPAKPLATPGGGIQMTVPNALKGAFVPL